MRVMMNLLLIVWLSVSLAACGGSSSNSVLDPGDNAGQGGGDDDGDNDAGDDGDDGGSTPDTTGPKATAPDGDLAIREAIRILFDEAMNPESLELGGTLAALSDGGEWNDGNTELTVSPADGAWEGGVQTLVVDAADVAGNAMETLDAEFEIRLVFTEFQAASVVLGQADFAGQDNNQGTGMPAANTINGPYAMLTFAGDRLWIPDYGNQRLLGFDGIPEANNASATWVVGQPDFLTVNAGTSATEFDGIQQGIEHDGRLYLLEYDNNRITIFDSVPLTPPATAAHVIGQADLMSNGAACTATGLSNPETMIIAGGKLIVADGGNDRVLIWNTVPTDSNAAPADIVLGQGSMTHCVENDDNQDNTSGDVSARTLDSPSGVWSDGERLAVVDGSNNRVLIWNTFPTSHFAPADVVLGQGNFVHIEANDDDQDDVVDSAPTARTLNDPYEGVWSNGLQLFVADSSNNRVLVWDSFPTENFQPADQVLGQSNFTLFMRDDDDQNGAEDATPSARTLHYPVGMGASGDKLLVIDQSNNRVLVFESQ